MHDIKVLLKIEFKRLFKSRLLYISLIIGTALAAGSFVNYVVPCFNVLKGFTGGMTFPFSVFNRWMGSAMGKEPFSTAYVYVCMLLAALPYCGLFVKDNKNQYILQYYSRVSRKSVHVSRFITTFISGGMIVFIPVLLNFMMTTMFLPALNPVENGEFLNRGLSFMADLYCNHIFIYTFIYMIQMFLYGGAFSVISLAVSFFLDNSFLTVKTPFVGFYGIGVISTICKNLFGTYSFSPMSIMCPSHLIMDQSLFAFIMEPVLVTLISGIVFFVKGADNEAL